jgi:hypothetical protein
MTFIDFAHLSCCRDEWPIPIKEWHQSLKQHCKQKEPIILEISGIDSLGAAILYSKNVKNSILIPTIAIIPTEYGDRDITISQAARVLNKRLECDSINPFVRLCDLRLWSILNGRYIASLIKAFGTYSPCIGCHVYVHTLRVSLAKMIGVKMIITGERLMHDEKVKINQTSVSFSSHEEFFSEYGIMLKLPLKDIHEGEKIKTIVGEPYKKDTELRCVFQSNLYDQRGTAFDISKLEQYYCQFVIPVAKAYIDWLTACWAGTIEPHREKELFNMIERRIFNDGK